MSIEDIKPDTSLYDDTVEKLRAMAAVLEAWRAGGVVEWKSTSGVGVGWVQAGQTEPDYSNIVLLEWRVAPPIRQVRRGAAMSNANEPAYPKMKTKAVHAAGAYGETYSVGGLTKREHAAIELRVPMSGDDDIDDMIRAANRRDFAAMVMQGYVTGGYPANYDGGALARMSVAKADALRAQLEVPKC